MWPTYHVNWKDKTILPQMVIYYAWCTEKDTEIKHIMRTWDDTSSPITVPQMS